MPAGHVEDKQQLFKLCQHFLGGKWLFLPYGCSYTHGLEFPVPTGKEVGLFWKNTQKNPKDPTENLIPKIHNITSQWINEDANKTL